MTSEALPLLCIGGTLCDRRLFAGMARHLDRPLRTWMADAHDRVEAAAAGLLDVVAGRFIAVGFSLGGFVAIDAMRQQPDRVAGLVLLSGNALPDAPANAPGRRADVAAAQATGLASWMAGRAEMLVPAGVADRDAIVGLIADMAEAAGDAVHCRQAEMNIHRPDLRTFVAAATVPVLALAGGADALCPMERYRDLELSCRVELEVIAGVGHYLPLEAPRRCAEAISDWLERSGL